MNRIEMGNMINKETIRKYFTVLWWCAQYSKIVFKNKHKEKKWNKSPDFRLSQNQFSNTKPDTRRKKNKKQLAFSFSLDWWVFFGDLQFAVSALGPIVHFQNWASASTRRTRRAQTNHNRKQLLSILKYAPFDLSNKLHTSSEYWTH